MKTRYPATVFGLTLFLACVQSLGAQSSPADSSNTQLRVYSRTVVEDVVVIDKAGHAVSSLNKEDFKIFENGKPQTITFFEPDINRPDNSIQPPAPPPNTFTNLDAEGPHSVTNVLLLDALDTWPEDQMYAQVQMVRYLASLPANLRLGIFTLTPEKLNLIWPVNQESAALRNAVIRFTSGHSSEKSTIVSQRQALLSALNEAQQEAEATRDSTLAKSALALQNFLIHGPGVIQQHNHGALEALQSLAHYLQGVPGRKNLFWIVGNFPHCEPIEECGNVLNALGEAKVSVYPIDAYGVDVNMGLGPDADFHQAARRFNDSEYWAETTGGRAYHVNNISQEIADAVAHGSHFYTLAYVPTDRKEEGRRRTIEIKVKGNYALSYRRHYVERTRKDSENASNAPEANPLLPLMGHGLPNSEGVPYSISVNPASKQPDDHTKRAGQNVHLTGELIRYDVDFQFSAGVGSPIQNSDKVAGKSIEVALVVYGQDFKPLNWEIRDLQPSIKVKETGAEQKERITLHMQIDAPKGDVYLRTGVYDRVAGKVGTLEIPLSAIDPMRKPGSLN